MKCARLHLQQRSRGRPSRLPGSSSTSVARRYCQRRLVDPDLDEDPRWSSSPQQRFRCNMDYPEADFCDLSADGHTENVDDLFLTVQTLQFRGDTQEQRRPRTCSKYKALNKGGHRMFVKQPVAVPERVDCTSPRSTCCLDDYINYILSPERSRPSSGNTIPYLCGKSNTYKINKAIQVSSKNVENTIQHKHAIKPKKTNAMSKEDKTCSEEINKETIDSHDIQETKVIYHKSGKRKSITISRTQSPETVQVIRVDVVCNYSGTNSVISEEDTKSNMNKAIKKEVDQKAVHKDLKNSQFANKYFLTKSIKALDESVAGGGARVTLFCKTFKLSDRTKLRQDANYKEAGKESYNNRSRSLQKTM